MLKSYPKSFWFESTTTFEAKELKLKQGCKGCEITEHVPADRILESNELSFVNYCNDPVVVGHIVIQPRRHVESLTDLRADEIADIIRLIWKYSKALALAMDPKPEKIYLCMFSESTDWHLHFHIVPRSEQIPQKERGGNIFNREVPPEEKGHIFIKETINRVKAAIEKLSKDP